MKEKPERKLTKFYRFQELCIAQRNHPEPIVGKLIKTPGQ